MTDNDRGVNCGGIFTTRAGFPLTEIYGVNCLLRQEGFPSGAEGGRGLRSAVAQHRSDKVLGQVNCCGLFATRERASLSNHDFSTKKMSKTALATAALDILLYTSQPAAHAEGEIPSCRPKESNL